METEEIKKTWFKECRTQTIETLPAFMESVLNNDAVNWDRTDPDICYDMSVHAVAACALAAAWAANERAKLSGFQASCVMWDFIRQWFFRDNRCGLRILDFDNMLYPQYEDRFDKTITQDTFDAIRKRANELWHIHHGSNTVSYNVLRHWDSISAGIVPFGYRIKG